jgi:alanine-glyoxylate transaminase/serine-glyoxylate transaminase/serine-pyruvate transaminase
MPGKNMNKLNEIKEILLMGPGPSCVLPQVYEALAIPTIGHRDPLFFRIMEEIREMLQRLFETENELTVAMCGTGSVGMETCFANLIEPGDEVLVLTNGFFSVRMQDMARRLGARVDALEFKWGTPVEVAAVKAKLDKNSYEIVAVVHAETSTGAYNSVEQIGALLRDTDTLYLVDAVTSLGGMPVKVDAWNIDAVFSATHKCLSCPPGLSPVSFSQRAVDRLQSRKTKVPNWYLDLSKYLSDWREKKRAYHHTAPVNMLYALYAALKHIMDEGMNKVYSRHITEYNRLKEGLSELGIEFLVKEENRLPMLSAIKIPDGVDETRIRMMLLRDHRIQIGAGIGPLARQIWRIGLMGHTARAENVDRLLSALRMQLA